MLGPRTIKARLMIVVILVVVVVVVVRALYVFDDPLFWLSRNWRSKKILQNAVLRKGANLKKGHSSESGFSAFFRIIMMARHKIIQNHCPTQCFGLRVRFSIHAFLTSLCMAAKQKVLQNTAFLQQSSFAKNAFLISDFL